jgi:hypothetical protein
VDELVQGDIDRDVIVRRFRLAAVRGRVMLDPQLFLVHEYAQISIILIVAVLEDDRVSALRELRQLGRRAQDAAILLLAKPRRGMPAVTTDEAREHLLRISQLSCSASHGTVGL